MATNTLPEYFWIDCEVYDSATQTVRKIKQQVRFVLDKDGNPQKLGDGAFGSVYAGQTIRAIGRPDVAIKVLYDNSSVHTRHFKTLSDGELRQVFGRLVDKYKLVSPQLPMTPEPEETDSSPTEEEQSDSAIDEDNSANTPLPMATSPQGAVPSEQGQEDERARKQVIEQLVAIVAKAKKSNTSSGKMMEEFRKIYTKQNQEDSTRFADFWDDLEKSANSTAVYRFEVERDINAQIQELLLARNSKEEVGNGNIIEVFGGCNNFQNMLQRNLASLKAYFNDSAVSYSDYVLVAKKYDYSLKDRLERSYAELKGKNGYTLLKELPHALRAREALYILYPIAIALKILHSVGFYHRDIKPGNIFILVLTGQGGKAEIVLGDLGNLPPRNSRYALNPDYTLAQERTERDYSPGTIHYRGPEQRYYRDIADVQVENLTRDKVREELAARLNVKFSSPATSSHPETEEQWQAITLPIDPNGQNPSLYTAPNPGQPGIELIGDVSTSDKVTVLIVQDPKFRNTLFEDGDDIIFSKDPNRIEHKIAQIFHPKDFGYQPDEFNHIVFVLNGEVAKADQKTQVEFYKAQAHRTDLFGLAAVLFDMLTVGCSAEQFYEGLRKYEDRPVDDILRRYDTLRSGEIDEANLDFAELFSFFRNENDPENPYPQRDIIELLLRCMLYQSPGTYYQEATAKGKDLEQTSQASVQLEKDTKKLLEEYTALGKEKYGLGFDRSILLHGDDWKNVNATATFFNEVIERLQGLQPGYGLDPLDRCLATANRLLYGTYYFWQITKFVRNTIVRNSSSQSEQDTITLFQILPSFITLRQPDGVADADNLFQATAPAVNLNALGGNRLELFISSSTNPFVANEIASMRRNIRLLASAANRNEDGPITCSYRFLDAAVVNRNPVEGDWLVIGAQLWRIGPNPNEQQIILHPSSGVSSAPLKKLFSDKTYVDGTLFSAIDPLRYYFEMLALYLQHLVFTYAPITTTTRNRIDLPALLHTFEIGPNFVLAKPGWTGSFNELKEFLKGSKNKLQTIHECFVQMLVKLTLHDAVGSYYSETKPPESAMQRVSRKLDPQMFTTVFREAEALYQYVKDEILNINIRDEALTDFPKLITEEAKLAPGFDEWVSALIGEDRIDIERIIKRSGQIEGEGPDLQPHNERIEMPT